MTSSHETFAGVALAGRLGRGNGDVPGVPP